MSYGAEQIVSKGSQSKFVSKGKSAKIQKNNHHRWMRQKMKDLNFIPQYNRYKGYFD